MLLMFLSLSLKVIAGSIFWQIDINDAATRMGSLFMILMTCAMKTGAQVSRRAVEGGGDLMLSLQWHLSVLLTFVPGRLCTAPQLVRS